MRKEIYRSLRSQFVDLMAEHVPDFALTKVKSRYVRGSEIVFQRVSPDLHRFIVLVPKANAGESFTVELAWSRLARFPELSMRPSVAPSREGDERRREEGAVRLSELVTGQDRWWDAMPLDTTDQASVVRYLAFQAQPLDEATAAGLIAPLVRDAVEAVVSQGVPYLRAIG